MRKNFAFLIVAIVLLLAAAGGIYMWQQQNANSESEGDLTAQQLADLPAPPEPSVAPATGDISGAVDATVTSAPEVTQTPQEQLASPNDIKIEAAGGGLEARSVGKADAPVTMTEYSSLTCPHCAHAHETVLPQLIKDYVETGKLRIVFQDFPLNQQALDASKVARCVDGAHYFGFITLLFSSIEQWAYSNTHPASLIQDAVISGLSEDKAKECMADKMIESNIIAQMQAAGEKYKVQATPTFIFNDGAKMLQGARPYTEFKATIDELLAAKK